MGLTSKNPAVSEVVLPRSSTGVGQGGGGEPSGTVVESATPHLAVAQADLEAEVADGTADNANARARAIAGHVAPDTVELDERRIRDEDNAAAGRDVPETTKASPAPERATPARPRK